MSLELISGIFLSAVTLLLLQRCGLGGGERWQRSRTGHTFYQEAIIFVGGKHRHGKRFGVCSIWEGEGRRV